ncbi:hypothetical protein MFIFM68171_03639 [Madurella fahalii]|uniref:Uncharacterized protein n=1 Tax=Madurella fahalii TaxID=1157608 RepID=A0ABQ0G6N7_9PEZI
MDDSRDFRPPVAVRDSGFSIVHEPDDTLPVADIVLVHGFQGNAWRTWSYNTSQVPDYHPSNSANESVPKARGSKRKSLTAAITELARAVSSASSRRGARSGNNAEVDDTNVLTGGRTVYWPKDLLPADCPDARVLVWGYDTVVTRGFAPTNKSDIFTHARDLLYSLHRERPSGRNLVFVAHSLGGLLVKEVLRRSQHAEEATIRDII